jgi:uncharacterized membrane protein YbhN (UPF0104 family)
VYFVARQLVDNWSQVVGYHWSINYFLLLASIGLHLVTFALFAQVWCMLMHGFGFAVPFRYGFKVAYIANLGRYIPGRIWPVFGMVYVAKKLEIPEQTAVASWAVAQLFAIPPSFAVGLAVLLIHPEMLGGKVSEFLGTSIEILELITIVSSLILIFLPNWGIRIANVALKLIKRPTIEFHLTVRRALSVYVGYLVCWIAYGLAFWLFTRAITSEAQVPIISGIGAFIVAYQAGYLTVFTPGGLGTRELVMYSVLQPYFGAASTGIAIAARIWNIGCDVIASLLALRIKM